MADSSHVRTPAQLRAHIESPRVRVPQTAGGEWAATTLTRTAAHNQYASRYQSASGHRRPRSAAQLPCVIDEDPPTTCVVIAGAVQWPLRR